MLTSIRRSVQNKGAIPATIAIINGKIKVGLKQDELEYLGNTEISNPIKTSRRDFPYVIGRKENGGTTVSGTLIVANKVGIPVFATGGIGGVHRGAKDTFDISADLIELGKCSVAVVSSGVKSILDIPKTLEYLETQGVFVATLGNTNDFPAFYSRVSGTKTPYCVENVEIAAKIIKSNKDLNLQSGMLFAVPVPEEYAISSEIIDKVIEEALNKAKSNSTISGKNVTPFLLSKVAKITGGKSLETNIALIKNNAKTAADIAKELSILNKKTQSSTYHTSKSEERRPVIIGGSNMDCNATINTTEIKLDGRVHYGNFMYTAGGVGRNICEALCKMGCRPKFISAVGNDEQGRLLTKQIPKDSLEHIKVIEGANTAQCLIVLDKNGDCSFLIGDMSIHSQITPELIKENETIIKNSPLMILDANVSLECIETALELAQKHNVSVFFEPTDITVSRKAFQTSHWNTIKFITPNLNELRHIASHFNICKNETFNNKIEEAASIARHLVKHIENLIITLGPEGILIARKGLATDPFLNHTQRKELSIRHYPVEKVDKFVNVSGAGDCLASGFIAAVLDGLPEEKCVSVGFAAAISALHSKSSVPVKIFDKHHKCWDQSTLYNTIL